MGCGSPVYVDEQLAHVVLRRQRFNPVAAHLKDLVLSGRTIVVTRKWKPVGVLAYRSRISRLEIEYGNIPAVLPALTPSAGLFAVGGDDADE